MLRASLKLVVLFIWVAACFPPAWLARKLNKTAWRDRIVEACSSGILRIAGIRLKVRGGLDDRRPLLVVSNHLSYFDVPMLASHAPLRFTPKQEISAWPVISTICRVTDAVFVERKAGKVKSAGEAMRSFLARGEAVSLFPEATTGNGIHVLPFKSSFFSLAEELIEGRELTVQPVALTYTRIRRLPIGSTEWPLLAWYGDMNLAQHVWSFLKLGVVEAELAFLSPVTLKDYGDRKGLAAHCHRVISEHITSIREKSAGDQTIRGVLAS